MTLIMRLQKEIKPKIICLLLRVRSIVLVKLTQSSRAKELQVEEHRIKVMNKIQKQTKRVREMRKWRTKLNRSVCVGLEDRDLANPQTSANSGKVNKQIIIPLKTKENKCQTRISYSICKALLLKKSRSNQDHKSQRSTKVQREVQRGIPRW